MLAQYYMAILHPFEEVYRNNVHNQQRKAQASRQALQGLPTTPARPDASTPQRVSQTNVGTARFRVVALLMMYQVPQTPARRLSSASQGSAQNPGSENGQPPDGTVSEQEQGIKRKLESEEADTKRTRQKTGTRLYNSSFPASANSLTPEPLVADSVSN